MHNPTNALNNYAITATPFVKHKQKLSQSIISSTFSNPDCLPAIFFEDVGSSVKL